MAIYTYRNVGTNQIVHVNHPDFDGNPLWELVSGPGGGGGDVTQAELDAVEADTTGPHGVPDFADLVTDDEANAKVIAHKNDADPHGDRADTTSKISTHAGAADPHGDRGWVTGQVGAANGIAALDSGTKVPVAQVPSLPGSIITSGAVAYARLPVGIAANTVAAGDVTTTALATKVAKDSQVFSVRDHGALGNGSANDTAAIQTTIDLAAAAGGRVYIPAGTYMVTPGASAGGIIFKPGLKSIFGDGASSVLKVPNAAGEYYAILANWDGTTDNDVGGLTLEGFAVDQNNTNNQWTNALAQFTIKPRYAVYIRKATAPVVVRNMTYIDLDNTNTIALAGVVGDHTVSGNQFSWGSCPVHHDTSVIYSNPLGLANAAALIVGNVFRSPGAGSKAALTAIETHGGSQTVRGNIIDGFINGMNITGIAVRGGEGAVVEGNIISEAKYGIVLWSRAYQTNTTDGLRNVVVRDNIIRLNGPGWASVFSGSGAANGILRDNATDSLPYEDITIEGNVIDFNNVGYTGLTGDSTGNGIEWRDSFLDTTDKRVAIRNNKITTPLAAGIRWSALGDAIDISGNTIRNPGRGSVAAGGAMFDSFGNGLMVNGALTNSSVSNNHVIDDQGSPTTSRGVYLFPSVAGSANNRAIGNRVPVALVKKIDTVTSTFAGNWLVRMDHETYSALTGKALLGSEIADLATGTVYRQTAAGEGSTWLAYAPGAQLVDIQVFTSSGTWTKPAWATATAIVEAEVVGGGGGGGSGRRTPSGTVGCGGGSGAGGARSTHRFTAGQLSATETITVGAAGTGGAAVTVNNTNGNNGTSGGTSSLGTRCRATGGTLGFGGTTAAGAAGSAGVGSFSGGAGAAASASGGVGANGGASGGSGGGGAGGGVAATPAAVAGGAGGVSNASAAVNNGAAGAADTAGGSAIPAADLTIPYSGAGGGGGGSSITGAAGAGGNGCVYGGGGGGGGAALDGGNSGAGGNGSPGIVRIVTR